LRGQASEEKNRQKVAATALSIVEKAIGAKLTGQPLDMPVEDAKPDTRNPAAVALSKLGASKGGKARAQKLSAKRRSQIARKAAKSRWSKPK